jgi:hypothetical protein
MDLGYIIYGGGFAVIDIVGLLAAFSSPRLAPFSMRLYLAYFCIVDSVFNTVYVAHGIGCEWATTELRHKILACVIIPNIIVGLLAWITNAQGKRRLGEKES